jgi:hypothetical protein
MSIAIYSALKKWLTLLSKGLDSSIILLFDCIGTINELLNFSSHKEPCFIIGRIVFAIVNRTFIQLSWVPHVD